MSIYSDSRKSSQYSVQVIFINILYKLYYRKCYTSVTNIIMIIANFTIFVFKVRKYINSYLYSRK